MRSRSRPSRTSGVSDLFGEAARHAEAQGRFQSAFKRGFQTRDAEMDLGRLVGDLD